MESNHASSKKCNLQIIQYVNNFPYCSCFIFLCSVLFCHIFATRVLSVLLLLLIESTICGYENYQVSLFCILLNQISGEQNRCSIEVGFWAVVITILSLSVCNAAPQMYINILLDTIWANPIMMKWSIQR